MDANATMSRKSCMTASSAIPPNAQLTISTIGLGTRARTDPEERPKDDTASTYLSPLAINGVNANQRERSQPIANAKNIRIRDSDSLRKSSAWILPSNMCSLAVGFDLTISRESETALL